ncbi:hypothetical protein U9M48_020140 [Paspalum notatum var. saurae]|uniref:Nucleoside phosphorylase domain-containing protein n=1 Tax=Paspalum notatum var. saurae TaxID=547442 RepID=A0AAQ3TEG4_PASNO
MERQPADDSASRHVGLGPGSKSNQTPLDEATIRMMAGLTLGSPTRQRQEAATTASAAAPQPAAPPRECKCTPLPMAPPPSSEQPNAAATEAGAISKILIIMSMEVEAMPLVHKFKLVEAHGPESTFPMGTPWVRYYGKYKDLHIDLVRSGKDNIFGVDSVGTVSVSVVTFAAVQTLKPDLVLNAGTGSGFNAKGANVGDVYLASEVAFHDRRIPIPVFDLYAVGARKTFATPNLLKEFNLKAGKLSTGDSLVLSPDDKEMILKNDATVRDTEGAAVAYVADMFSTPAIFVKAVTDVVDREEPTPEAFLANLMSVTTTLELTVAKVVEFISGKRFSDL